MRRITISGYDLEELLEYALSVKIELNASDTFAYACADSVTIDEDGVPLLIECFSKFGNDGITAFMSEVRGETPIKPWCTEAYYEAKEWLKDRHIPNEIED